MSQAVEALATALMEAWNRHDVDRVAALHAFNYEGIDVGQATPLYGPDEVRHKFNHYLQAFPDMHFAAEDILAQGQRIVLVWTAQGTHQGTLMHIPPTGRRVQVRGVSVLTVQDDKITHGLHVWDVAGLLRYVGLLPEL